METIMCILYLFFPDKTKNQTLAPKKDKTQDTRHKSAKQRGKPSTALLLFIILEPRTQIFTDSVCKYKSRRNTHYFGRDSFVKCSKAFIFDGLRKNLHSSFLTTHVLILNAGLDDVHGRCDEDTEGRTDTRGDEILVPSRFVIVFKLEDVVLDEGGSEEECKGARYVADECRC